MNILTLLYTIRDHHVTRAVKKGGLHALGWT